MNLNIIMPVAYCRVCKKKHVRPVGRNCTSVIEPRDPTTEDAGHRETTTGGAASLPTQPTSPHTLPDITAMFGALSEQLMQQVTTLVQGEVKKLQSVSVPMATSPTTIVHTEPAGSHPMLAAPTPSIVPTVEENSRPTSRPATIPSVPALRNDDTLQAAVSRRLTELELAIHHTLQSHGNSLINNNSNKSGRERVPGSQIKRTYVAWPHEFVHVGSQYKKVTYDEPSQSQFSVGLLGMVNNETDTIIKEVKLKFISQLHEDICDIGFKNVHSMTAILLSKIEENQLSWNSYTNIDRAREKIIFTTVSNAAMNPQPNKNFKQVPMAEQTVICSNFNLGKCEYEFHHIDSEGKPVKHLCSFCLSTGLRFAHSEVDCRRKTVIPPRRM